MFFFCFLTIDFFDSLQLSESDSEDKGNIDNLDDLEHLPSPEVSDGNSRAESSSDGEEIPVNVTNVSADLFTINQLLNSWDLGILFDRFFGKY